ncbi:MAG: biotin synthase BioB [Peptostreptococcaceae bacterium]|jgi:biotin synthase|nr:biotin synthase BioB [Peptostreptococcaceae bacterium]
MHIIKELDNVLKTGIGIEKNIALELINYNDLKTLLLYANKIREKYIGDYIDLCTIMNVKSGNCSEDCKFCAQSSKYNTNIDTYKLLTLDKILKQACKIDSQKVDRFSLVSSGKNLNNNDLNKLEEIYKNLKTNTDLKLCASFGLLKKDQAIRLKNSGVIRYHHNIETSMDNYINICTTHTYNDRLSTINNAKDAGLEICCGGIWGLGETNEQRIQMAYEIKEINPTTIPINILNPIKNTEFENKKILCVDTILRYFAIYRFILPKKRIKIAGGRSALKNNDIKLLQGGVDSILTGDFLTTIGSNIALDKSKLDELNLKYKI